MSAKELPLKQKRRERHAMCVEFPLIEQRLMRAGLLKTARKMNAVVQAIGWECAELTEKEMDDGGT